MEKTLYTLGHSTRPLVELLEMLARAGIVELWDVRRFPGSRHNPQFSKPALERALGDAGLSYRHVVALGGRRKGSPDSVNTAWTNASFRAYADHMASPEFDLAFRDLLACAERKPIAVMCAEALPHRCHRRLIADNAAVRGWDVIHLLTPTRAEPHRVHPDARLLADGRLVYRAGPDQLELSQTTPR